MPDLRTEIARSIGRTINEKNHMRRADDIFQTIEDAGFVVVPHVPTEAMMLAGVYGDDTDFMTYRQMVDARPSVNETEAE